MNDDQLQNLRNAFQNHQDPSDPANACPSPGLFWEAVACRLPKKQKQDLIDHLRLCQTCAQAWRLAVELQQDLEGEETDVPIAPIAPPSLPLWKRLAAPLALVAVLMLAILIWPESPTRPVNYRVDEPTLIQSQTPASLPRDACLLEWSIQPDKPHIRYEIQIYTASLELVAKVDLTESNYMVPESALSSFPQGTQLLWYVTAIHPDNRRTQSESFILTIH